MAKELNLENLKKEYKKIQTKHNLPDFQKLNEDFHIEKIAEVETDFLIREIRKLISEKLAGFMRFTETLLNPTNAPMFVFSMIKSIGQNEKTKLTEIYKKLAKSEINLIELDTEYSEKKEAEFIKNSDKLLQEIKKDTLQILDTIKKNWDNKFPNNNKKYFG